MRKIGRRSVPVKVIVCRPETEEGRRELAVRAAGVHADAVVQIIQGLDCPADQKRRLLEAVIDTAKNGAGEQTE